MHSSSFVVGMHLAPWTMDASFVHRRLSDQSPPHQSAATARTYVMICTTMKFFSELAVSASLIHAHVLAPWMRTCWLARLIEIVILQLRYLSIHLFFLNGDFSVANTNCLLLVHQLVLLQASADRGFRPCLDRLKSSARV